jgi:AcrR family transcriptional regulator
MKEALRAKPPRKRAAPPQAQSAPPSAPAKPLRKSAQKAEHKSEDRPDATKPRSKRREQQRAIETRQTILSAALSEFGECGFDAASIRNIALRTGLQHPLITYHFRSKEILWKAVAENAFIEIRRLWDSESVNSAEMSPIECLRAEYISFLRFTITHPDFHQFMVRENRPSNPRLPWLVESIISPTVKRLLPQIKAAQTTGHFPAGNPYLLHYMMIGMMSVLSSLRDEIKMLSGIDPHSEKIVAAYIGIVDAMVFHPLAKAAER